MLKTLSISIAAYNVDKYICGALDSLISSGALDDLEVLIVNDGSTDDTELMVKTYQEKYPDSIFLINKVNGGYGSTINTALKVAQGKYFKLLDGDDWFDVDNLCEFVGLLKNETADMILTDYTEHYESCQVLQSLTDRYKERTLFNINEIKSMAMHSLTIRTNLIKEISITENCFYTDLEYVLKCYMNANNFIYYPMNIYCYRLGRDGQSVSIKGLLKHIDEHKYITDMAYKIFVENREKFANLEKIIYGHIATHISALLGAKPSKENYSNFVKYKKYAITEYANIEKNIDNKAVRLAFKYPRLFYRLMSFIKRKKHHIK